jgi:hypothetical protein
VGQARGVLEVHSEGDGTQFPDIFIMETAAVAEKLRPLLLIAGALGVVTRSSGASPQLVVVRKDADGFDLEPLTLGADWQDAALNASEATYDLLRGAVTARLGQGVGDGEAVRAAIVETVDQIKASRGGKPDDPIVVTWNSAGREAMKIVRGETSP